MAISRNGTRPSQRAPTEHFTGTVRLDPLFQSSPPARVGGACVTFEPCARSDWHTHPFGQTLIVTFGCGFHQRWGEPIEEIRPGDVVTVGPNEKHWHGASPTTAMTHIAIQESLRREGGRVAREGDRRPVPGKGVRSVAGRSNTARRSRWCP